MATLAAPPATRSAWSRVARAMTVTGGASLAGGLLNMAGMKIVAVVAGPAPLALLATLQQTRLTALTAATLNGQTALVQGTAAGGGGAFVRTALALMTGATLATCVALLLGAETAARYAGLAPEQAALMRWLALPVALGAAFVFVTGLLNAQGAIGTLARVQIVAPAAMALLAYPVARAAAGNEVWWILLLAAPMGAALGAATAALTPYRFAMRGWLQGPWFEAHSARRFFEIAAATLLTGLVTTLSVLAVRSQILRQEGAAVTGLFDAAWAISMSQAALVLASLQTYYLPALARTSDRAARTAEIRRVLVLACGTAAAIIALLAALKPVALAILYSDEFLGAARYLRWTLIGDYLKVTSWILSVPLVAAADLRGFAGADLAAYAVFTGGAWWGQRFAPPAEAAAIAFAAMYAAHLLLCGARLWRAHGFRPGIRVTALWFSGLACVLAASAAFWNR